MSFASTFPGFKLRLTRWGGIYLVLTVVLGFSAVNTGNNALMATLGLALASYAVSGTWSRQVLGGLEVAARFPQEIFAGRRVMLELEVHNRSRFFPAYGVVVRDGAGQVQEVLPVLAAGKHHRLEVETVFPHRGWNALHQWRVEVLLPLGFFVKSKRILGEKQVLAFPRLLGSSGLNASAGGDTRDAEPSRSRGREGEVTQLREFREGDERRQIHWKQTARQQRLIAVERQRPSDTPVVFVVDNRVANPEDAEAGQRFERLLSEVATEVVHRLRRGGSVGVVVGAEAVGPTNQRRELCSLMRPLAEAQAQPIEAPPPRRISTNRGQVMHVAVGA